MRYHKAQDSKEARIAASWLAATREDASWLASVADETIVATTLVPGRFAYIAVDQGSAGLVVGPGTRPADIICPTDVLVLTNDQLAEAARRMPAVAAAWAGRLDASVPVA